MAHKKNNARGRKKNNAPNSIYQKTSHQPSKKISLDFDFSEIEQSVRKKRLSSSYEVKRRSVQINFQDENLFGDDDAGQVDIELLKDFSLVRRDCKKFFDEKRKFITLNAPKGSGKTTMCRLLENELNDNKKGTAQWLTDSEISPSPKPTEDIVFHDWELRWANNISYAILCKIVEHKDFISDSDLMEIYHLMEKQGQVVKGGVKTIRENFQIPFIREQKTPNFPDLSFDEILKRVDKKLKKKVWLFIDEVDQAFFNEKQSIFKVSGMLLACRRLVRSLDNIVIRSTIRPNVLAVLESEIDCIANIKDSIVKLDWPSLKIRSVIAKRVESYAIRSGQPLDTCVAEDDKENWLLSQILLNEELFDLGSGNRQPHVILSILGKNRPRWVLSLLKCAAENALDRNKSLISIDEIFAGMKDFGLDRIKNLASEFKPICPDIQKIITRFSSADSPLFYHNELIEYIREHITSRSKISISGVSSNATPTEIANLLYVIGFIDAGYIPAESSVKGKERFKKMHMDFYDNPVLVSSIDKTDSSKYIWEVHPVFRAAIGIEKK